MSNSDRQTVGLILLLYGLGDSAKINLSEWLSKCFVVYQLPTKDNRVTFKKDVDFTKYNKFLDAIEEYGRNKKRRFSEGFFHNLCLEIANYHMTTVKNDAKLLLWTELHDLIIADKLWVRNIKAALYAKDFFNEALILMRKML